MAHHQTKTQKHKNTQKKTNKRTRKHKKKQQNAHVPCSAHGNYIDSIFCKILSKFCNEMKPRLAVTTRTQVLLHLWHVARSILCGILGIAITKPINPIKRSTITERETLRRQLSNDGMILCAIAPFKEIQIQSAPNYACKAVLTEQGVAWCLSRCDSKRAKIGKGVWNAAEAKNATSQYGEIRTSSRDYTMM